MCSLEASKEKRDTVHEKVGRRLSPGLPSMLCGHRGKTVRLPARLAFSRVTERECGNLPRPHTLIPTEELGPLEGTAEPWPCDQLAGCLAHLMHWLAPGCVPSSMASSWQVTGLWGLMSSMGVGGDAVGLGLPGGHAGVTHAGMVLVSRLSL